MVWAPISEDRNLLYALSWNYAQDAKFAFDADNGAILDLNPAALALTGFAREELVGQLATTMHPVDERSRIRHQFRNASGDPGQSTGFHVQHKDGRRIPILVSYSAIWKLAGRSVVICVFRDITDQIETEHRLSTQNWALSAYAGATLALGQARSPEGLLQAICDAIARESVFRGACVLIAEEGPGKRMSVTASSGISDGYIDKDRLTWDEGNPWGQGPTGIAVRTNVLQILEDTETSPIYATWRDRAREFGVRSSLSIPLRIEGSWHGVLVVFAAEPNAFQPAPVEVFQRLAEQMAHGIRALDQQMRLKEEREALVKTQAQLTDALSAMVAPIVTAMEMRDPYTAGHQSRVAEIACAISREMGWPEHQTHGLKVAALVHDIGKISIPAEILTKPGKLNGAEWAMICLHPETGYAILKDVPFVWPVAEIVRQHHEKLDGSGYPAGLKGDEILPEARILAVADVVEAMASYRPYRPGIDLAIVLRQIESESGRKLDAEVVHTCLTLFRERQFTVPGWIRGSHAG